MSDLNLLYKQAILEHNRNPRYFGKPAVWTHHAEGLNAICGDLVEVYLNIVDGVLEAVHFDGESCAIATASASMMAELSTGLTTTEWQARFDQFKQLMDPQAADLEFAELAQVNTLATVKKFPSRIKSATLCWYAAAAAMQGKTSATTE